MDSQARSQADSLEACVCHGSSGDCCVPSVFIPSTFCYKEQQKLMQTSLELECPTGRSD